LEGQIKDPVAKLLRDLEQGTLKLLVDQSFGQLRFWERLFSVFDAPAQASTSELAYRDGHLRADSALIDGTRV
jgi:hypothetical protein